MLEDRPVVPWQLQCRCVWLEPAHLHNNKIENNVGCTIYAIARLPYHLVCLPREPKLFSGLT